MSKPLILAPISSVKMAEAVIDAGADVVYAGLKGWSLRPDMFEMAPDDLERAIALVLKKGKKINLAFNCFYRSDEIPAVIELIEKYAKMGASGLILSEIGLIRLVRKRLPDLSVHVSVQTSASSSIDVDYYNSIGISGVVLPRNPVDLSLENIRALTGKGVAIEVFALGDDSTNYDGRCTLSAYFFQRKVPDKFGRKALVLGNANRCGYCFLACKRPCSIEEEKGNLLYRGDLSLHRRVPELVAAGVEIFKIQGREFPLPLIKKMVATFRSLLDNYQDEKSFRRDCNTLDRLVSLKLKIANNHLWLLAKSSSPFWKRIRPIIEKPWDLVTTALWTAGRL